MYRPRPRAYEFGHSDSPFQTLRPFLGFDHADEATALRTHIVCGRKTFGPVQAQRNHCGWAERYLEARSQALSADVARVLLEESNHDFAETQHGVLAGRWPPSRDAPDPRPG